jgi:hypothetical protein
MAPCRCREKLENLMPADVYFGRDQRIFERASSSRLVNATIQIISFRRGVIISTAQPAL